MSQVTSVEKASLRARIASLPGASAGQIPAGMRFQRASFFGGRRTGPPRWPLASPAKETADSPTPTGRVFEAPAYLQATVAQDRKKP